MPPESIPIEDDLVRLAIVFRVRPRVTMGANATKPEFGVDFERFAVKTRCRNSETNKRLDQQDGESERCK
jgi:hypothetical protein